MKTWLHLFLRDLRAAHYFLPLFILLYLLQVPFNYHQGSGYLVMSILWFFMMAVGTTFIDWRYDTDAFFAGLPLSRATLVLGRYSTALIVAVVGMLTYVGVTALLHRVIEPAAAGIESVPTFAGVLALGTGVLVLVCLFYPAYFAWGVEKAWVAFLIAAAGAGWGMRWLGADDDSMAASGGLPLVEPLRDVEAVWYGLFNTVASDWGGWVLFGMAVFCLGMGLALSVSISVRWYARRDL